NLTQDRRSSPSPSSDRPIASAHDQRPHDPHDCAEQPCKATNDLECDMVRWQMRRSSRARHSLRLQSSMTLLRPVYRCEPHNSEVVACDIFATPKSLKSNVGRNLKSPFSNIHAVPFKLCPHSRPATVQNCLSLGSAWLSNPHS